MTRWRTAHNRARHKREWQVSYAHARRWLDRYRRAFPNIAAVWEHVNDPRVRPAHEALDRSFWGETDFLVEPPAFHLGMFTCRGDYVWPGMPTTGPTIAEMIADDTLPPGPAETMRAFIDGAFQDIAEVTGMPLRLIRDTDPTP